jgi:hypothetical protein
MKITVKKTDKRHTAGYLFKYFVTIKTDPGESGRLAADAFYRARIWCWEQWGPSREVNDWGLGTEAATDKNEHWGWISDQWRFRIYLRDKDEAALFTLKWS